MAKFVKKQLIEKGKVVRSYLGIYIQAVTQELAESFGMDEAQGILVSQVAEGSGADKGGLKAGDIILELNGKKVENVGVFRNTVSANPPGTGLALTVFRDGDKKKLDVTTGAFPEAGEEVSAASDEIIGKLGLTVKNLTSDLAQRFGYEADEGVIVSQVQYGSAAALAGIRPGNLITSVNRKEISTVEAFRTALSKSAKTGRVLLHVSDNQGSRFVVLNVE
jgi:serine protease Do